MSDDEFRTKVASRLGTIAASLISLQVFVTLMAFIVCNQLRAIPNRLPPDPLPADGTNGGVVTNKYDLTERTAFPQTIYAVALVWFNRDGTRHVLANEMFAVSGDNPLTRDEAKARGRAMTEARWDEAGAGPLSEWTLRLAAVSRVAQVPAP